MESLSWPLSEIELASELQRLWGITPLRIVPLSMGRARKTWVYHVTSAASAFLLKLKEDVHAPGVVISGLLADHGINVSTPILSINGNAWEVVHELALLVFRFIEGCPITMQRLDAADWCAIGSNLRAVHDTLLPEAMRQALASETFTPAGQRLLPCVQQAVSEQKLWSDPIQEQFVQLWSRWGSLPSEFFGAVCVRGQAALKANPTCCLCHGDFQSGNILKSSAGEIHFIDWDDPAWAPRERDLMFVPDKYKALFSAGYGHYVVDEVGLEFQSANWLLQEALDCADRILFVPTTGTEEKQWALELAGTMLTRMKKFDSQVRTQSMSGLLSA